MLTDAQVKNAKAKPKSYKLADSHGLFLLVMPSGGKSWRYKYRFSGREKLLSLGQYPVVMLADARERHLEARKMLAAGIDPGEEKQKAKVQQREKESNTFELVALEWLEVMRRNYSASHVDKVEYRLKKYLLPTIGGRPVADINAPEVLAVLRPIEQSGYLETVKRVKVIVSQVMRYAIGTGRRTNGDSCPDLKGTLATPKAKHMPTFTAPEKVAELMRAIRGYSSTARVTPVIAAALRLAPLAFVRIGELRQAKWADVDFALARWCYKTGKNGVEHEVPLSSQAVDILRGLHSLSGQGEFVFPGGRADRPMSEAAINRALQALGYDTKTEITGHGFRAMARTMLAERLGQDPFAIEHQLGHRVPDTLGGAYNRTKYREQRREMMQAWADYLDELADSLWPVKNDGVNS